MTGTVLGAMLEVFEGIAGWIVTAIEAITPIFYANGALTFLGVLSIAGLGFSIFFLLLGLIQRFMHFAG